MNRLCFKNNRPKFVPADAENMMRFELTGDGKTDVAAARVLKRFRSAFEQPVG